jgi:uncharacterized protein YegP (UPF0339 family)
VKELNMPNPVFSLNRSKDNQYYFNLVAANGEIILTSQRYRMRGTAVNGIISVKDNAAFDEQFDRLPSGDQFYFVLRAFNGQVIGVSERYTTRAARDAGIETVMRCAAEATIRE